jgi:hypothetical protein
MSATFTFSRRNLTIALTITLPAAATWVALAGALTTRPPALAASPFHPPPTIAMVQPHPGGAIPQDKPVVMFRFAAGEPDDPIDVASFTVALDGEDRTAGFQLSGSEGWGPLGAGLHEAVALGSHALEARICSARGVCATTLTAIMVRRGVGRRAR